MVELDYDFTKRLLGQRFFIYYLVVTEVLLLDSKL